jgi:histidinol-phosphate aminotransferase
VTLAALVAVRESLADRDNLLRNVKKIVEERDRLSRELGTIGMLRPWPSRSNFILCDIVGLSGRELRTRLADRGILTRHYGAPRLARSLRVSVGLPAQNEILLTALREIDEEVRA